MAGSHQRALTPRRRVPRSFRVIRALRARGQQREVQSPCRYRPVSVLVIRVAQTTAPSTTPPPPAERGEEHGAAGGSARAGVRTATRRPTPRLDGGSVRAVWWCCGVALTRYPCAHPRVRCDCATKICLDKPAARPTAREQGAPRGPGGAPWRGTNSPPITPHWQFSGSTTPHTQPTTQHAGTSTRMAVLVLLKPTAMSANGGKRSDTKRTAHRRPCRIAAVRVASPRNISPTELPAWLTTAPRRPLRPSP